MFHFADLLETNASSKGIFFYHSINQKIQETGKIIILLINKYNKMFSLFFRNKILYKIRQIIYEQTLCRI